MGSQPSSPEENESPDILASLPTELQHAILKYLREEGGIECLFALRAVSRRWCRLVDDNLYIYFIQGPEVLYCYVNLWNRFHQKLIQQRVTLRLRVRTMLYKSKAQSPASPTIDVQARVPLPPSTPPEKYDYSRMVDWQPPSQSSKTPSLRSHREYTAYIYDACFDHKFNSERDIIRPVDIDPGTHYPISLGTGLAKVLELAHQPARSGTIFPLFHVIQQAWDFILGEDATLMPIYPPIASEAWLQIRLATGTPPSRYRDPPATIFVDPSRDPYWPFRFDEYTRIPNGWQDSGQHQYAVVSRLALPNVPEDEGILLVSVRDTEVGEWIQDARYREIMQSMIAVADVGRPQEFILGGAVIQLQDYERFIPRGMVRWFRRRILGRTSMITSPASEEGSPNSRSGKEEGKNHMGTDGLSERAGENYTPATLARAMLELLRPDEDAGEPPPNQRGNGTGA